MKGGNTSKLIKISGRLSENLHKRKEIGDTTFGLTVVKSETDYVIGFLLKEGLCVGGENQ